MTTDPSNLLRMLEPAVRPGPASGVAPRRASAAPFEVKPFEQLLQEARQEPVAAEKVQGTSADNKPGPLDALADFGHIQNASLRQQLQDIHAAARGSHIESPQRLSPPE